MTISNENFIFSVICLFTCKISMMIIVIPLYEYRHIVISLYTFISKFSVRCRSSFFFFLLWRGNKYFCSCDLMVLRYSGIRCSVISYRIREFIHICKVRVFFSSSHSVIYVSFIYFFAWSASLCLCFPYSSSFCDWPECSNHHQK